MSKNTLLNVLAIEAATETVSVALQYNDKIDLITPTVKEKQASHLLILIDALLKKNKCTLNQLDCIALSQGPGSFTGLRVGFAVAQALSFGGDVPIVTINTLQILALAAFQQSQCPQVLVATDARMQEIYTAAFRVNEGLPTMITETIVTSPEAIENPFANTPWVAVGNAFTQFKSLSQLASTAQAIDTQQPDATYLIPLACTQFQQKNTLKAESALPFYCRDKVTSD